VKEDFGLILQYLFSRRDAAADPVADFEQAFRDFTHAGHAVAVSSGRTGLKFILMSLDLKRGDEVILPAYTLKDILYIIQSLCLKVVLADIDPLTFNISPESVSERITDRTRVILATHMFGAPCEVDRLVRIAADRRIALIEDCAHAACSFYRGKHAGSFGHAAFFSFESIKPVNTYGGGMVITGDPDFAARIRRLRGSRVNKFPFRKIAVAAAENILLPGPVSAPFLYLLSLPSWHETVEKIYRMSQRSGLRQGGMAPLQAEIGIRKLSSLKERVGLIREKASYLVSLLSPDIQVQHMLEHAEANYYFFVVKVPDRLCEVRRYLLSRGIDAGVGSEVTDDCSAYLRERECVNAREVFSRALQLPLHYGMDRSSIRFVADALNAFYQ